MIMVNVPARAGVLGNPSDGFHGKTLSIPVRNFRAQVVLFEWEKIEILPGQSDAGNYGSIDEMLVDIRLNGYYGGMRLIKATVKQFFDYVKANGLSIPSRNFTLRYTSNIPRQVGLAGSSAIIVATIKALCQFYGVTMDRAIMANHVLWSETKELGISAGLQDRVVQVFDEPVFMDFDRAHMERNGFGKYEVVPKELFPRMYLAYQVDLTHKDVVHNDVRKRWECGDTDVASVMEKLGANAAEGYAALKNKDLDTFKACLNKNYDLRASVYPIAEKNVRMVNIAREIGATSKFPGSGGAIIGTYESETQFTELFQAFSGIGCSAVKVDI
ncbi:MAG: GHMP kinase [Candidatus Lokiarchaeota archaeon]|nr:GHMP kinase [Candidatus Lokiarchaeota archaeon]